MFDDEPKIKSPGLQRKLPIAIAGFLVLGLLAIVATLAIRLHAVSGVNIPKDIAKQLQFAAYLPGSLPDRYKVVPESFTYDENILAFRAEDGTTGSTIAFTEQKKPKSFDFDNFYKTSLKNATTLDGTPYPSVAGQPATQDGTALSIVTDSTWIFVTTKSPLSNSNLQQIAKNIQKR